MKNYLFLLVIFIPVLILQILTDRFLTFNYIGPDLILIMVVYITLSSGLIKGSLLAFIFGFIYDIVSGGILGISMFSLTLASFISGFFYNQNKKSLFFSSYKFLLIVFLSALISSFFKSLLESNKLPLNMISLIIEYGLIPAVYTSALSVPIIIITPKNRLEI